VRTPVRVVRGERHAPKISVCQKEDGWQRAVHKEARGTGSEGRMVNQALPSKEKTGARQEQNVLQGAALVLGVLCDLLLVMLEPLDFLLEAQSVAFLCAASGALSGRGEGTEEREAEGAQENVSVDQEKPLRE